MAPHDIIRFGFGDETDCRYVVAVELVLAKSCWRLLPRDARPIAAAALVVLLICNITYIWGQAFGRPQALDYTYVTLYGATVLPLAAFAVERTVHTFWERRKPERPGDGDR